MPADVQEGVGMGKGLAQLIDHFAEIGVRLCLGRVWPQQTGNPLCIFVALPIHDDTMALSDGGCVMKAP